MLCLRGIEFSQTLASHDRHSAVWRTRTDDSEQPALPIFHHKHPDSNHYLHTVIITDHHHFMMHWIAAGRA